MHHEEGKPNKGDSLERDRWPWMVLIGIAALLLICSGYFFPQFWTIYSNASTNRETSTDYFHIQVLDYETRRGVPLVMLRTVNYITHWTDSLGNVAFFEPGMMDQPVFFGVLSDGYEFAEPEAELIQAKRKKGDASPYDPGLVLNTTRGGKATIYIRRVQLAERAYRLTGGGLYRDTILVGEDAPSTQPLLDASGVLGQDTLMVSNKLYRGRRYLFFGDTACPRSRRQDNCNSTGMYSVGATVFPSQHHNNPQGRIIYPLNFTYFVSTSEGFAHPLPMAPVPPLYRNTWICAITVATTAEGEEVMFAVFTKPKVKPDDLPISGVLKWSDTLHQFQLHDFFPTNNFIDSTGLSSQLRAVEYFAPTQPSKRQEEVEGEEGDGYVYLTSPFVYLRVNPLRMGDISAYEAFTPLLPGTNATHPVLDPSGWGWKPNSIPFTQALEASLVSSGILPRSSARMQVVDSKTGQPVFLDLGAVNYNKALQKYLLVSGSHGSLYISLADNLLGPWKVAVQVATHNSSKMSCYNPLPLPWMDEEGGKIIYMACSFTAMWSGDESNAQWYDCLVGINTHMNCAPIIPRYEYNNLVYRLDVSLLSGSLDDLLA